MLVLSRYIEDELLIGENIRVKVLSVGRGRVRLGITAPKDLLVLRSELVRTGNREEFDIGGEGGGA